MSMSLSGADDPLVGTSISQYQILSRLGRGGMGVVYKARDTSLDRTVAIKFLPAELHADADADARFVHEARAVSALDHPNVAVVHEIGRTEGGQRFIVMAYYAGETLRQKISLGPLPIGQVVDYALQLSRGLMQAHDHGIVHRDIKPENVIVTERGVLKILDFGLAKRQDVQMTVTGVTMGTLAYMSPEQTFGGAVDHRTDLWSLGVVLFEILTGQHPFMPGKTKVPESARDSIAATARALRPEAPDPLIWIIDVLLRRDPDERFPDMGKVVEALELLSGPASSAAMTAAMPTQSFPVQEDPAPSGMSKQKFRMTFGAGALFIALVAGFLIFNRPPQPAAPTAEARNEARELTRSGMSYFEAGQLTIAQAELERATAVDSTYSEAWTTLAAVLFRRGAYSDAIAAGRTAVRLSSTNSVAYYNLALALEESGRPDEAIETYTAALEIDSTFMLPYSAIGNLYIMQGRIDEALHVLEQGRRAAPESEYMFLIYKNMGKAQLADGDPAAALPLLERSLTLRAGWPETLSLLAESHAALGHTDQSRAYLQQYLEVEPDAARKQEVIERLGQPQEEPVSSSGFDFAF